MIVNWEDLTIRELNELSKIAEETCGFEITASGDGYTGEIKGA